MMEGDLHSQQGRVDLQGGNSRPPWKSPPDAVTKVASLEIRSAMLLIHGISLWAQTRSSAW